MRFTIPGEPQGKGRPRVVRRGAFTKAYTPEKTIAYENLVKLEFERQCATEDQLTGSVAVEIFAYYGIPASASKRKRIAMLDGVMRPNKKPDCDNVAKTVCDALNGLAYRDDAQIVRLVIEKAYAAQPRVEVYIGMTE